jgi:hypothetical protein
MRTSSRRGESGSTMVEVIAGMALISFLGLAVWSATAASLRAASRVVAGATASARLLLLCDSLRDRTGRVRPPWWETSPEVEEGSGPVEVRGVDGDPRTFLRVSFSSGRVTLEGGGPPASFPGFESFAARSFRDATGGVAGIAFVLHPLSREPMTVLCRFGSRELLGRGPR